MIIQACHILTISVALYFSFSCIVFHFDDSLIRISLDLFFTKRHAQIFENFGVVVGVLVSMLVVFFNVSVFHS